MSFGTGTMEPAPGIHYFMRPPIMFPYLTNAVGGLCSTQWNECGFFETQYWRCMEAYGLRLGRRYCHLEGRDFWECVNREKEYGRYTTIQQEKRKQFITGQRDRISDKRQINHETYLPDHFDYSHKWM